MSSTEAARPSTSPVADDGRAVLEDEARGARRRARTGALGEPPARGRMEDAARTAQPAKD